MSFVGMGRGRASRLTVGWPIDYPHPGTRRWAKQVLSGLRATGAVVEYRSIEQKHGGKVLVTEFDEGDSSHLVAFDSDDLPEIDDAVSERVLLYFKFQCSRDGYERRSVVPGGYPLANNSAYRYLPLLRAIRARKRFRYDVYGRFGLRWGGADVRQRAVRLLSERSDFTREVTLFRYPGGPDKVPYRKYLLEIPRAKVCVNMPGQGEFCHRLIDYFAVGACVVGPEPNAVLPSPLIDGEHMVNCASDLSDLADICAQLVRDEHERERIARNARAYFDKHLHRRELASYYARMVAEASSPHSVHHGPGGRDTNHTEVVSVPEETV